MLAHNPLQTLREIFCCGINTAKSKFSRLMCVCPVNTKAFRYYIAYKVIGRCFRIAIWTYWNDFTEGCFFFLTPHSAIYLVHKIIFVGRKVWMISHRKSNGSTIWLYAGWNAFQDRKECGKSIESACWGSLSAVLSISFNAFLVLVKQPSITWVSRSYELNRKA